MNEKTTTLSLEGLALANLFITQQVVSALVQKGLLSQEAMQACFEAAKQDLHRSTLSITADEANGLLAMVWAGFVAVRDDPH